MADLTPKEKAFIEESKAELARAKRRIARNPDLTKPFRTKRWTEKTEFLPGVDEEDLPE